MPGSSKTLVLGGASLLAGLVVVAAVEERSRPWRGWQEEFHELERRTLRQEIADERERREAEGEDAEAAVEAAAARLDDRRSEVEDLEEELDRFRHELRAATRRSDELAATLADPGDAGAEAVEAWREEARQARMTREGLAEQVADLEEHLGSLRGELDAARERLAASRRGAETLEARLAAIERGAWLRRAPGLDLFDPTRAITELAGGDRCTTCHLGTVRDDLDTTYWPELFRGHPEPRLYASEDSVHPASRFGCTVCHGGEGRSTDFARAGHGARGPSPILPDELVPGRCGFCHDDGVAAELEAARQLVRNLGCAGCHGAGTPRPGPSLRKIAAKTRPAWAARFIAAPRRYQTTAWMPHAVPGAEQPEGRAEIAGMVAYLWDRSEHADFPEPPNGDEEAGRLLFHQVGCAGCHLLEPGAERADVVDRLERLFGPNLSRVGSKTDPGWLYAFLRDPAAFRPDTPMPDLRLDAKEAADLTSFLMTRRDTAWEDSEAPAIDPRVRDARVLAYLQESETIEASLAHLEAMTPTRRDLYLGERSLARHGCAGCHEIPGLEDAGPAAPSIAEVDPRRAFAGADLVWPHAEDYGLSRGETVSVSIALLERAPEAARVRRTSAVHGADRDVLARGERLIARYGCRGCHRIGDRGPGLPAGDGPQPPDLTVEGARVQPQWLFEYLDDPGAHLLRPWLGVRMPSYRLSTAEKNQLVLYFATLARRDLFVDAPAADPVSIEVGRAVTTILQCQRCHDRRARSADDDEPPPDAPAPSFALSSRRLRPTWVVDLVLDPQAALPGTAMPDVFQPGEGGRPDASFLAAAITAPMFDVQRQRLAKLFPSEQALVAYLEDPEKVAEAVRDYLWAE